MVLRVKSGEAFLQGKLSLWKYVIIFAISFELNFARRDLSYQGHWTFSFISKIVLKGKKNWVNQTDKTPLYSAHSQEDLISAYPIYLLMV